MSNQRNPDDLKNNLTEMQFYVTQNHGTEPPFTGRLLHNKRDGVYHCLVCDAPLFNSQTKYDSGCGWPSFYEPVSDDAIRYLMTRRTGCNVLKFAVANVMPTWGMSSRTVLSQQANVSASTQRH
jgi:methionine-R-sulfoxide reductase